MSAPTPHQPRTAREAVTCSGVGGDGRSPLL